MNALRRRVVEVQVVLNALFRKITRIEKNDRRLQEYMLSQTMKVTESCYLLIRKKDEKKQSYKHNGQRQLFDDPSKGSLSPLKHEIKLVT